MCRCGLNLLTAVRWQVLSRDLAAQPVLAIVNFEWARVLQCYGKSFKGFRAFLWIFAYLEVGLTLRAFRKSQKKCRRRIFKGIGNLSSQWSLRRVTCFNRFGQFAFKPEVTLRFTTLYQVQCFQLRRMLEQRRWTIHWMSTTWWVRIVSQFMGIRW